MANQQCNVSDFQAGGLYQVFGYTVSMFAFWAVENSNGNTMYIGQALLQMSTKWLTFKLIFRLCLSAYIVRCMWKKYYRHYSHLVNNIRLFGVKDAPKVYEFEIVVGDPTSIILLNPVVSVLFVIDFWISVDFVSKAFYHIAQLVSMKEFFLAYLYLSRTLWFAYGTLSVVSHVLKKLHCERYFRGIDPTWTAIVVATIAGPFTYLQSRIALFAQIYQFLFTIIALDKDVIEASLPATLYVCTIGTLPLIFGFLPRCRIYPQARI
ncbi:hypothetical protein THRCLA_09531 [Thraustotheca clavata]|uniref:Transmembrane protein n=1 Tax=Thraustotheca clavata TaxID=74557 RepID=A0A1V9YVZ2_9STRA|nr:hypothetical protein THRCLA_09531 [Thraustotheca clavata]